MMGKVHAFGGVSIAMMATYMFYSKDIGPILINGSLGMIGALLPDIDHNQSSIRNSSIILKHIKVRNEARMTVWHSIFPVIFFFVLSAAISFIYSFQQGLSIYCFAIGYGTHLIQDAFTIKGIPLLYPISDKLYSIGDLTTGSNKEFFVTGIIFIAYAFSGFIVQLL